MEVARATPLRYTLAQQLAETPDSILKRTPLRPMSSHLKRSTPSSSMIPPSAKRARRDDETGMQSRDIDARIRMLFPNSDVVGKVSCL